MQKQTGQKKNRSFEFKQTNTPVKTALPFHNENQTKFLYQKDANGA